MRNNQRLITLLWQVIEGGLAAITAAFKIVDFALAKLIELLPSHRAVRLEGSFGQPRLKGPIATTQIMTPGSCTNEEEIDALCNPLTSEGQPAEIDGPVAWEKIDGDAELGTVSADGKTATFRSQDAPGVGVSHFRATADADLGQGVTDITLDYELTVNPAGAASLGGSFGTPRIKTAAPGRASKASKASKA